MKFKKHEFLLKQRNERQQMKGEIADTKNICY